MAKGRTTAKKRARTDIRPGSTTTVPRGTRVKLARAELRVTVPMLDIGAFAARRLDGRLDKNQANALRRLFDGLQAQQATLASGREVRRPLDAVRWVLENLEAVEAPGAGGDSQSDGAAA